MKKYLVISEVSKKQSYIFKSNSLKDNIGASAIIEIVTEKLPEELCKNHNGKNIYAGGGNSIYLFEKEEDARNFVGEMSKTVLNNFAGVELFMTYVGYDDEQDEVQNKIQELHDKLNIKKSIRDLSFKKISFGVEKICAEIGVPAFKELEEALSNTQSYISKERYVKMQAGKQITNREKEVLGYTGIGFSKFEEKLNGEAFLKELDDIGTKDKKSYLAIVSLDGNKMGQKIKDIRDCIEKVSKGEPTKQRNQKYLDVMKEFSKYIKDRYQEAFEKMITSVIQKFDYLREELDINQFPIRPIILAGDDVCFICDARIAISATNIFLQELSNNEIPKELIGKSGVKMNACAGISIVRKKYPFFRAYELAEELCKNGKARVQKESDEFDASLIDWHISQKDISSSIEDMRMKTINKADELYLRPLLVGEERSSKMPTYKEFKEIASKIKRDGSRNSKIKASIDKLVAGKYKSQLYMIRHQLEDVFTDKDQNIEYGFKKISQTNYRCMYFDAIEAMDLYIDIEGDENE